MRRLALLALACTLAGCANEEAQEPFPPTNTEVATGSFPPGATAPFELGPGRAFLTSTGAGTLVRIEGVGEAGAIREGTCEDPGDVVYELPDTETRLDAELVDLLAGRFVITAGEACAELVSPGEP